MKTKKLLRLSIPLLAALVLSLLLLAGAGLARAGSLQSPLADWLPRPLLETTEDDNYSIDEDQVLTVAAPGVLGNDGSGAISATLITDVSSGVLSLNLDGSFVYTPALNYNGLDQFVYTSTNITGTSQYTAYIDVLPINDAPLAVADGYLATENITLTVGAPGVLGNDSDVESDPLTATVVTDPAHGTLNLLADGSFTYTPDPGFNVILDNPDSFTYQAGDGNDLSNIATVTLTVNDLPAVNDDASATPEDTPINVNVLFNDEDFVGGLDYSTLEILVDGTLGSSTITTDPVPRLRYTPDPNAHGQDLIDYQVCDTYGQCGIAVLTMDVTPVNDAPIANNDSYSVAANNTLTRLTRSTGVLANDTDIDTGLSLLTAELRSGPAHGTLTFNANGTFTYTPDPDFVGSDSFRYRAYDGLLYSPADATVSLTVTNTGVPITQPDVYSTSEDTPLVVAAPGVLGNDEDPEQFPLTAALASSPPPANGTPALNPDGSFTFTPDADFNGTATFHYQADDGTVLSNAEVVTITVTAVNDAPVAAADSYLLDEDTLLDVAAAQGVLDNDQDVDGDPLTADLVSAPAHGALTLNSDGSFTYDPDLNYHGPDSFTYRSGDGALFSSAVTVSLTIEPVNDPPQAGGDAYIYNLANANGSGSLLTAAPGVLANDSDVENDDLSVSGINNQPDHGAVQIEADGSFVYTPDAGYNGLDFFEYLVSDGSSSSVGRVDITIDTEPPLVTWTTPSNLSNGGVYLVPNPLGQQITLAFEVSEQQGGLDAVSLRHWNTRLRAWQDLQTFSASPYSLTFHSDALSEFGFNDVRVFAYDEAGNLGTINVFIYRPGKIFLPRILTP